MNNVFIIVALVICGIVVVGAFVTYNVINTKSTRLYNCGILCHGTCSSDGICQCPEGWEGKWCTSCIDDLSCGTYGDGQLRGQCMTGTIYPDMKSCTCNRYTDDTEDPEYSARSAGRLMFLGEKCEMPEDAPVVYAGCTGAGAANSYITSDDCLKGTMCELSTGECRPTCNLKHLSLEDFNNNQAAYDDYLSLYDVSSECLGYTFECVNPTTFVPLTVADTTPGVCRKKAGEGGTIPTYVLPPPGYVPSCEINDDCPLGQTCDISDPAWPTYKHCV